MSEKIQFQTNIPVELALQFLEGKPVDSQFGGVQHLFSTTDNRVFFVSEMVGNIVADQVKKLGVQKGEPIELCKAEVTQGRGRKGIQWIVKKVGFVPGQQPDGTFVVPAPPANELEAQLAQSSAAPRNGKPGTGGEHPRRLERLLQTANSHATTAMVANPTGTALLTMAASPRPMTTNLGRRSC